MLHQAKLLAMRGELISRRHVEKQAAFLVISLRQHLLAIATQHAGDLVNISNEHEMQEKLGAIIREKLEVLAQLPSRVTDERWLEALEQDEQDEKKQTTSQRAQCVRTFSFILLRSDALRCKMCAFCLISENLLKALPITA
jgi:hypothetical protein